MQASADQTGAFTSTIGGLASIAGSTIGAMAEVRSSPWNADGTLKDNIIMSYENPEQFVDKQSGSTF